MRRQFVEAGQGGGVVARQARPVFVEKFQQRQEPGLEPAGRHRQDAPRIERDGEGLAVLEAAHHAEQVRLLAQQAQQRRHQADALAGNADAEIEIEPVAADRFLDRDEPVFRLGDAIWEVLGKLHRDFAALQRRHALVEEGQPADGIVAQRHQAIIGTLQALVISEAALPAFQPDGLQQTPDFAFRFQIALQRQPLAVHALPHERRRPFHADHAQALRIVEMQHGQRQIVVQAIQREVAETALGQHQARTRLARGDGLRCIGQRQGHLPLGGACSSCCNKCADSSDCNSPTMRPAVSR